MWLFPQNFWIWWSLSGFMLACEGVRGVRARWGPHFSARSLSRGVRRVPLPPGAPPGRQTSLRGVRWVPPVLGTPFGRQTSPWGVRGVPLALGAPFGRQPSPHQVRGVRVCPGDHLCVLYQRPRWARARMCRVKIRGEFVLGHGTFVVLPTIVWWGTMGSVLGGRFNLTSLD